MKIAPINPQIELANATSNDSSQTFATNAAPPPPEDFNANELRCHETPWPEELQRIFKRLNIEPPMLLQGLVPHGYYDKNHPVNHSNPNALPGGVFIQEHFISDLQKKWIMVHEIGHALEDRCMPKNWSELIDQTRRNRVLKRVNKGHYNYNLKPNECWAYAVTQFLSKDESWIREYVFGSSRAAQQTRYFSTMPHGLFPLLPHWDPADFQLLKPVMEVALQKASVYRNIDIDIS